MQAGLLLTAFSWLFGIQQESVGSFIGALAVSLGLTAALSMIWVANCRQLTRTTPCGWFGNSGNLGAPHKQERCSNTPDAQPEHPRPVKQASPLRVYSIAYYGLEAMWLVPRALAPLVYTQTAAESSRSMRLSNAKGTGEGPARNGCTPGHCHADSRQLVCGPGFEGINPWCMRALPALFGAAASIIAHHLSGIEKHHWNAATSGLGLITLLILAREWAPESGAVGATWAASSRCRSMGLLITGGDVSGITPGSAHPQPTAV